MKKIFIDTNTISVFIIVAILFPFLGNLGFSVYNALGKLYYIALVLICLLALIYDFLIKKEIHTPKHFISISLLLAIPLFFALFYGKNFNHIGLVATCFIVFLYFYNSKITTKTISIIFQVFIIVFFVLTQFLKQKIKYAFNPNTYAFIIIIAYTGTFLNFQNERNKSFNLFKSLGNSLIAVYLSYIYLKSETELLAFCFFIISFFILQKFLNHNKNFYIFFTISIFLFTISITGISSLAIKKGILSSSFISSRGEIWVKSYDMILHNNILSPNVLIDHPHAHNGFLDLCLNYNLISALAFTITLIYSLLKNNIAIRDDNANFSLYLMLMTYIFINSVESFITDFTSVYFFIIPLAILLRNINIRESNKNE